MVIELWSTKKIWFVFFLKTFFTFYISFFFYFSCQITKRKTWFYVRLLLYQTSTIFYSSKKPAPKIQIVETITEKRWKGHAILFSIVKDSLRFWIEDPIEVNWHLFVDTSKAIRYRPNNKHRDPFLEKLQHRVYDWAVVDYNFEIPKIIW